MMWLVKLFFCCWWVSVVIVKVVFVDIVCLFVVCCLKWVIVFLLLFCLIWVLISVFVSFELLGYCVVSLDSLVILWLLIIKWLI